MTGPGWSALGAALLLAGAPNAMGEERTCDLLTDSEVIRVQGTTPTARIASDNPGASFRLEQCFFRTADPTRSVSLARAVPHAPRGNAVREFWHARFGEVQPGVRQARQEGEEEGGREEKRPPQPVAGLGEQAYWVGDAHTGSLYVLSGAVLLRVSVGGGDTGSRVTRARALAQSALPRLQAAAPRPR